MLKNVEWQRVRIKGNDLCLERPAQPKGMWRTAITGPTVELFGEKNNGPDSSNMSLSIGSE